MSKATFVSLAISSSVVARALKVALVVGTLLAVINHGDALLNGEFGAKNVLQILLTYLVPYAVATYSAVHALQNKG